VLADARHRPEREFSVRTSNGEGRGNKSPQRLSSAQANTGSFDSVSGLASESTHSAQDDRPAIRSDKDIVRAGQRLAKIHVHYEQQPEYPLTKREKEGAKLDYRVEKMRLSKGQNHADLQPIPHLDRHPKRSLRIPPREPLCSGMGHRSVPGLNRQAQRHHQRSQPP
jgi:hypothetical protein